MHILSIKKYEIRSEILLPRKSFPIHSTLHRECERTVSLVILISLLISYTVYIHHVIFLILSMKIS